MFTTGICSRSSSSNMSFHGSPETAGDGGMISIEHSMNPPATETNGPGSGFPRYITLLSFKVYFSLMFIHHQW